MEISIEILKAFIGEIKLKNYGIVLLTKRPKQNIKMLYIRLIQN